MQSVDAFSDKNFIEELLSCQMVCEWLSPKLKSTTLLNQMITNSKEQKFYDEQYTVRDLENVLRLPVDDMRRTIIDLPNGAKESLKNIASTQVVQGVLDSVKKIKVLDELFGTELNLLATVMS